MSETGQISFFDLLDEIEQRANAASPGPWVSAVSEKPNRAINIYAGSPFIESSPVVAWAIPQAGNVDARQANALLIAAARSDVPALVKLVRHYREHLLLAAPGSILELDQAAAQLLSESAPSIPARTESAPASE